MGGPAPRGDPSQVSDRSKRPAALLSRCRNLSFPSSLPEVSVVFIFVNEALSVLLRSIRSAMERTPPHLLKEIILVDDNSSNGECPAPCPVRTSERRGQPLFGVLVFLRLSTALPSLGVLPQRGEIHDGHRSGRFTPQLHPLHTPEGPGPQAFPHWLSTLSPNILVQYDKIDSRDLHPLHIHSEHFQ